MAQFEYEYKGSKFKLKPDVLSMYRDGIDLIALRKDLIFKHTKDIDRTVILGYELKLKELQEEQKVLKSKKKDTVKTDEKIKKLDEQYKNDSKVSALNYYYAQKVEDAILELMADKKGLFPVLFPKFLEGDTSVFNYGDIDFLKGVGKEVVNDFFYVMTENRII